MWPYESPRGTRWIGKKGMWVLSGNCRYSIFSFVEKCSPEL